MENLRDERIQIDECKKGAKYARRQYLEGDMTEGEYYNLISHYGDLIEYTRVLEVLEVS